MSRFRYGFTLASGAGAWKQGEKGLIRCSECKKPIIEDTKYMDWLSIMNFFEFLYNENYIVEITYTSMVDRLMTFKLYCFDEEEK